MSVIRQKATAFPAQPTLQNITYTDRGTQYRIISQLPDRSLLGVDLTNLRLVHSTDDGTTWATYCNFVFTGISLNGSVVHWLPSGELALATNKNGSSPGASVWVSSGWVANPTTATFTKTLQLPDGLNFAYHGFGGYKNTLLASEYGNSWSGTAPYSRYVYRSDDGGQTWATVFDFGSTVLVGDSSPIASVGANVHLHGCAYDPWFDRMWLLWGDAPSVSRGGAYSDDGGATWNRVASAPELYSTIGQWQCLAPVATEAGLLTMPDQVPALLGRIGRKGYRSTGEFHMAHLIDPGAGASSPYFRGSYWFRSQVAGAPLLATVVGVNSPSPGAVVMVTEGGRKFRTIFVDPAAVGGGAQSVGLERAFGPTNTGRYVISSTYTGRNTHGDRIVGDLADSGASSDALPLDWTTPTAYRRTTVPRNVPWNGAMAALTSGRLQLFAVHLNAGDVVSNITFLSGGTALATGTAQWFELRDLNGNLLAQTADDGATAWAANSLKTLALTSAYTVPESGVYYLGIVVVATTVPTMTGVNLGVNTGAVAAPILAVNSNTGLTNPASSPSTATMTSAASFMPYAGIA